MLCFEAAARSENFARAAEDTNITQSAVSRQIQILEAFVGQSLFVRTKQRVKLTSAGSSLLANLSPLLEQIELTILKTQSHDSVDGSINVGVYPTLGSRWLMPKIMQLENENLRQSLNLVTYLNNSEIDPSLVDLAIVQGDATWKGYRADFLMGETLVVVGSPTHVPQKFADPFALLDLRILQHSTRPLSWDIWFSSQGLKLPRKIIGPIFSQFEMLIDATKGGHGIAIIPEVLVKKEFASGNLIKVHEFEASTASGYYLLTPESKVGIPKIERLRKWFLSLS